MKSIDEILWPKGQYQINDAEQYAKQWWIDFHAAEAERMLQEVEPPAPVAEELPF